MSPQDIRKPMTKYTCYVSRPDWKGGVLRLTEVEIDRLRVQGYSIRTPTYEEKKATPNLPKTHQEFIDWENKYKPKKTPTR